MENHDFTRFAFLAARFQLYLSREVNEYIKKNQHDPIRNIYNVYHNMYLILIVLREIRNTVMCPAIT